MAYLDTGDLAKRLAELQEDLADLEEQLSEAEDELLENDEDDEDERAALQEVVDDIQDEISGWHDEYDEELEELLELKSEVTEWSDGNTLIPEDEFVDYCKEMLKDTGDLPANIPWYIIIDWEATAKNIKADYAECEYQGETYLYRM